MNEQMYSFLKRASKQKEFVDRLTGAFKRFRFFETFTETAPRLLDCAPDTEMCTFVLDLTIKTAEISPVFGSKISADLLVHFVTHFDRLTKPEDSAASQLIYESICRLFELIAVQDPSMNLFKGLLEASVSRIFEESFESVNFVLVFGKLLAHMVRTSVG